MSRDASCRYIHENITNCNQTFHEILFEQDNGSIITNRYVYLALGSLAYIIVWPFLVYDFKCVPFGRIAAVLAGSLLMVSLQVISQDEVFCILGERENLQTLCLLLGMMMFAFYLDREELLSYLLRPLMKQGRSFYAILWFVCFLSAFLSALITNDAACVLLTPLILQEHKRQRRSRDEYLPLLLAIATSANIGSAATVMGNPQNAYIAAKQGLNLAQTFLSLFPAAMIGLGINTSLLYLYTYLFYLRKWRAKGDLIEPLISNRNNLSVSLIAQNKPRNIHKRRFFWVVIISFLALAILLLSIPDQSTFHFDLGLVPVGCASLLMLIDGVVNKESSSRIVRHIDWGVILLFCGLFVWLGGFKKTNIPKAGFLALKDTMNIQNVGGVLVFTLFIIVGSNLLSNVPMVVLIVDYIGCLPGVQSGEENAVVTSLLLAWVATIAGNFTLFGSVANLIVAEKAKRHIDYTLGFFSYLLFGLVSTFVVMFVGLPIVYFSGKLVSHIH